MASMLRCIRCSRSYPPGWRLRCECGEMLEAVHEFPELSRELFDARLGDPKKPYNSGVWRFKELIYPGIEAALIVTRPEGNTNLYSHRLIEDYVGLKKLSLKHEGENPTGSFKDRGMTVGVSEAWRLGARIVACASTGNTSASLAAYAAQAGLDCVVFIPKDMIAIGKLAQTLSYGARVLQVEGNFDDAMRVAQEAAAEFGIYLLNSVNPWRIEGQKSIIFELLQQRSWSPPDWVVVPAGNLGNTSAFGKALMELKSNGLIQKLPKLAVIQAEGANPFYRMWMEGSEVLMPVNPETIASAIRIGNPVSWKKALRALKETRGVVEQVSDQQIMDAKAIVDRCGIGCEPASAASVAGAKNLVEMGAIDPREDVVCVLTGNLLKDADATVRYHLGTLDGVQSRYANRPIVVEPSLSNIEEALAALLKNR